MLCWGDGKSMAEDSKNMLMSILETKSLMLQGNILYSNKKASVCLSLLVLSHLLNYKNHAQETRWPEKLAITFACNNWKGNIMQRNGTINMFPIDQNKIEQCYCHRKLKKRQTAESNFFFMFGHKLRQDFTE